MIENRYPIEIGSSLLNFEFESIGPKGTIIKVIRYTEINVHGFYNLGFGDKDLETGNVNDLITSNNDDSQRVLATVVQSLYLFTDYHPNAVILATGSTLARTRLYRIGITKNLLFIEKDFELFGLTESGWEIFVRGVTYLSFSVIRKT